MCVTHVLDHSCCVLVHRERVKLLGPAQKTGSSLFKKSALDLHHCLRRDDLLRFLFQLKRTRCQCASGKRKRGLAQITAVVKKNSSTLMTLLRSCISKHLEDVRRVWETRELVQEIGRSAETIVEANIGCRQFPCQITVSLASRAIAAARLSFNPFTVRVYAAEYIYSRR